MATTERIEQGEISRQDQWTVIKVYPYPEDHFYIVTGWLDHPIKGYREARVQVNWGSIGAVSIPEARAYAAGILRACDLAEAEARKMGIEVPAGDRR